MDSNGLTHVKYVLQRYNIQYTEYIQNILYITAIHIFQYTEYKSVDVKPYWETFFRAPPAPW